jgi:hypothetical protein
MDARIGTTLKKQSSVQPILIHTTGINARDMINSLKWKCAHESVKQRKHDSGKRMTKTKDIINEEIGIIIWYSLECGDNNLIIVKKENFNRVYNLLIESTCDIYGALELLDRYGIEYQIVTADNVYEHIYEREDEEE